MKLFLYIEYTCLNIYLAKSNNYRTQILPTRCPSGLLFCVYLNHYIAGQCRYFSVSSSYLSTAIRFAGSIVTVKELAGNSLTWHSDSCSTFLLWSVIAADKTQRTVEQCSYLISYFNRAKMMQRQAHCDSLIINSRQ